MPETVKHCIKCGRIIAEEELICLSCGSENEMQTFRSRIVTNGDRIRAMTDEELADWLTDGHDICDLCQFGTCRPEFECEKGVLEWLKQEVSEDAR